MRLTTVATFLLVTLCGARASAAQDDIRTRLLERGATAAFADEVQAVVRTAAREGLPTEPLTDKALEGWAKRRMVPPERIVAALQQMTVLLQHGRDAVLAAGMTDPTDGVVSAAGMSLGRGLTPDDVRAVVDAAPDAAAAASGLQSAASLAAQGFDRAVATRAVTDHFRQGGDPAEVLELPSAAAGMMGRGMPMSDIARAVMEGRGISLPGNPGRGASAGGNRPGAVPPARGNPAQGGRQGQRHSPRP